MIFKGVLKPHQKQNVEMFKDKGRFIIGDPVGRGKTVSALACVVESKEDKVMVLLDKSLALQWVDEIAKFTNGTVVLVSKDDDFKKDGNFYIVVYEQLLTRKVPKFNIVIMDEVTKVKNRNKLYTSVGAAVSGAKYRMGLTATPVENKLDDFYNIFNIVNPSIFEGINQYKFRSMFVVGTWEKVWNKYKKKIYKVFKPTGYKNIALFKKYIDGFYTCAEALPIKRNNLKKWVEMSEEQREMYYKVFKERKGKLTLDNTVIYEMILTGVYEDKIIKKVGKKKIKEVLDTIVFPLSPKFRVIDNALEGYKSGIVVFSKFLPPLEYLKTRYDEGVFEYIHGDMPQEERRELRNRLNSQDLPILGITTAGERGLDLYGGQLVIFLNQLWNPARNEQIAGRITRENSVADEVDIVKILCKGSIDGWVEDLLCKKLELFKEFVPKEEDYERILFYEPEEVDE